MREDRGSCPRPTRSTDRRTRRRSTPRQERCAALRAGAGCLSIQPQSGAVEATDFTQGVGADPSPPCSPLPRLCSARAGPLTPRAVAAPLLPRSLQSGDGVAQAGALTPRTAPAPAGPSSSLTHSGAAQATLPCAQSGPRTPRSLMSYGRTPRAGDPPPRICTEPCIASDLLSSGGTPHAGGPSGTAEREREALLRGCQAAPGAAVPLLAEGQACSGIKASPTKASTPRSKSGRRTPRSVMPRIGTPRAGDPASRVRTAPCLSAGLLSPVGTPHAGGPGGAAERELETLLSGSLAAPPLAFDQAGPVSSLPPTPMRRQPTAAPAAALPSIAAPSPRRTPTSRQKNTGSPRLVAGFQQTPPSMEPELKQEVASPAQRPNVAARRPRPPAPVVHWPWAVLPMEQTPTVEYGQGRRR